MMKNNKRYEFREGGFPDHLAPDEEKKTDEYGLKVAKTIEKEWWYVPETGGSCNYKDKRKEYHRLRLYARGEQDLKVYKDMLGGDGEDLYSKYDWRPLQIAPKFMNLLVNKMTERLFNVRAESVDSYSTDLRNQKKRDLEDHLLSKPILNKAKEVLNVDLLPQGHEELPETKEEIELHMKLKYKPAVELACEEALKYTLGINDYPETQTQVLYDIASIGIGAQKQYTDKDKGILVKYVDPADMVYSYPKDKNFKDVHYFGEVEKMTIGELQRISGKKFTKEELKSFAGNVGKWDSLHGSGNTSLREKDMNNMMVEVLHFNFKSTNKKTYKKKYLKNGGFKLTPRESTFTKKDKKKGTYDVVSKVVEVWYEGSLVLGTNHLFNYKLCENMIRPNDSNQKAIPNYVVHAPEIYENKTKSLLGRMITYIDHMQYVHLKIQQLVAKTRPSGVRIDIAGLSEVSMGDGGVLTPLEIMRIYNETGNVISASVTDSGAGNGGNPITELRNGVVEGLDRMIGLYNHYLSQLRDAIGIPQGVDASSVHPDTLVGVQEQLASNSNTATRHLLEGVLNMTERTSEALVLRLKDIFKYSNLKEQYISSIGKLNVNTIESLNNLHLHELGILIELKPDAQERQMLESSIAHALSNGGITLDDAIDVRAIDNIKLANQVLKVRRAKRESDQRNHDKEMESIRMSSQAQAAQQAAEASQMEIQAKTQSELQLIQAKAQSKISEINAEKEAKEYLMAIEFEYQTGIKRQEVESVQGREKYKEDRKDQRQDKKDSSASELIDQRRRGTPPKKFESNNDNMGGIDFDDIKL